MGAVPEIGGADVQERVDRAGGSSRVRSRVGRVDGLADRDGCLAWGEGSHAVCIARQSPLWADALREGAIAVRRGCGWEGFGGLRGDGGERRNNLETMLTISTLIVLKPDETMVSIPQEEPGCEFVLSSQHPEMETGAMACGCVVCICKCHEHDFLVIHRLVSEGKCVIAAVFSAQQDTRMEDGDVLN